MVEIILIKPLRNLGKIGELVQVKDGYYRNYLMPEGFAVRATESNKLSLELKRKELEAKNTAEINDAQDLAKAITGKDLIFIKQASDDGRLFGSVSTKEIATELAQYMPYKLSYSSVIIETPIKSLGTFFVDISLHADVLVKVNIIVARSQTEANDTLYRMKKESANEAPSDATSNNRPLA